MKRSLFLILSILWYLQGYGQDIFNEGYIITLEQDTISGLIYERSDAELAKQVKFKRSGEDVVRKFRPSDLLGFGINGRNFERMAVVNKRRSTNDTSYIFAKNILRGKIDLFVRRHIQKNRPDIFLINNRTGEEVFLHRSKSSEMSKNDLEDFLNKFKNDSTLAESSFALKYSEEKVRREILKYNKGFSGDFPLHVYEEKVEKGIDILIGIPVTSTGGVHFRAGAYYNRSNIERSSNFSIIHGLVYHHWSKVEIKFPGTLRDGEPNQKWQLLNLIPIGIHYHGNNRIIRPYGYLGVGVALLRETNKVVENYIETGEKIRLTPFPTINTGIGAKIKIGEHFLITEITPTINNIFFNVGFSI